MDKFFCVCPSLLSITAEKSTIKISLFNIRASKNVISLIKYYTEKNDAGFRNEAYEIAKGFDASGDYQLSDETKTY